MFGDETQAHQILIGPSVLLQASLPIFHLLAKALFKQEV